MIKNILAVATATALLAGSVALATPAEAAASVVDVKGSCQSGDSTMVVTFEARRYRTTKGLRAHAANVRILGTADGGVIYRVIHRSDTRTAWNSGLTFGLYNPVNAGTPRWANGPVKDNQVLIVRMGIVGGAPMCSLSFPL
jgi:hypothetical protein